MGLFNVFPSTIPGLDTGDGIKTPVYTTDTGEEKPFPSDQDWFPYTETPSSTSTSTNNVPMNDDLEDYESFDTGWSLSEYMKNNPGMDVEAIMAEASHHSDEFAEKYLDYLVERGELDRANEYTAEREDTAYQRLVADLKAAGLNPALMYGSSASTTTGGSQGYVKMVEGANSRGVTNYSKLKTYLLNVLKYKLDKGLGIANSVIKGADVLLDALTSIFKIFG